MFTIFEEKRYVLESFQILNKLNKATEIFEY